MESSVTSRVNNILISGCGVAGPALAYWLQRYGCTATVVERAPHIRTGGYRLQVGGVVLDVLERMGILADVRATGGGLTDLRLVHGRGERVTNVPVTSGDDWLAIRRGDLSEIIYRRTKDTVEYLFADTITGIDQQAGGVHVTFQHAPPRRFDLVIGADGLHSTVRALAFGDKTRFVDYLDSYVFLSAIDNYLGLRDKLTVRKGYRRGSALTTFPGNDQLELMFVVRTHEPPGPGPRDELSQKRMIDSAFAGDGWEVPTMLHKMWDADEYYFGRVAQVRMDRWSDGRVVLVGDAAYCPDPMSGAGTSSALVGAYVLAGELLAAEGDHAIALPAYQSRVAEYVRNNQRMGSSGVELFTSTAQGAAATVENLLYGAVFRLMSAAARLGIDMTKLAGWEKKVHLPHYEHLGTGKVRS